MAYRDVQKSELIEIANRLSGAAQKVWDLIKLLDEEKLSNVSLQVDNVIFHLDDHIVPWSERIRGDFLEGKAARDREKRRRNEAGRAAQEKLKGESGGK